MVDRESDDDRLSREQRERLRRILSALDTNEKVRAFEDLISLDPQYLRRVVEVFSNEGRQRAIADLIEAQPAIKAFLEAKRSTEQITTFIAKMAKWIVGVAAALALVKGFIMGGLSGMWSPKP